MALYIGTQPLVVNRENVLRLKQDGKLNAEKAKISTSSRKQSLRAIARLDTGPLNRQVNRIFVGQTMPKTNLAETRALARIGNHPSIKYKYRDIWYDRLAAVESLNSNKLTNAQKQSLRVIAKLDPHPIIREEASRILAGKPSQSMIKAAEARVLARIGNHPSINYKYGDIWYDRLSAVKSLNTIKLTNAQIRSLKVIAKLDPDWRIREVASAQLLLNPIFKLPKLLFVKVSSYLVGWL